MDTLRTFPFRVDITGNFLKSERLQKARMDHERGDIPFLDLEAIESEEIEKLVAKQKELGLKVVTDGELRRTCRYFDFFWGLDGVEMQDFKHGHRFNAPPVRTESVMLTGKIGFSYFHPVMQHFQFLKSIAGDDVVPKLTIPSAGQLLAELLKEENIENTNEYYLDIHPLVEDIAEAYRRVIEAIRSVDCRFLQLDDYTRDMLCEKDFIKIKEVFGNEPEDVLRQLVLVNEFSLGQRPADMLISLHICYNNCELAEGEERRNPSIPETLHSVPTDAFCIEYNGRFPGEVEMLEFAENQSAVLGLVTTNSSKLDNLEDKDQIRSVIVNTFKYVPLEKLRLSLRCDFTSDREEDKITEEQQWDRIRMFMEVASDIWNGL